MDRPSHFKRQRKVKRLKGAKMTPPDAAKVDVLTREQFEALRDRARNGYWRPCFSADDEGNPYPSGKWRDERAMWKDFVAVIMAYDALAQAAQEAGTALKAVTVEEINGYNVDKLLEKAIECLSLNGGHQNCYAIRAMLDARQQARAALDALAKSGVKI